MIARKLSEIENSRLHTAILVATLWGYDFKSARDGHDGCCVTFEGIMPKDVISDFIQECEFNMCRELAKEPVELEDYEVNSAKNETNIYVNSFIM